MEEKICTNCKNIYPANKNLFFCDLCKNPTCKTCSQLCSTEIRVMELAQKNLIYGCPQCLAKPIKGKQLDDTGENTIIKIMHQELKKCLDDLQTKIKDMEKEYSQQNKKLQKLFDQKSKELEHNIEEKTKSVISAFQIGLNSLTEEIKKTKKNENEVNKHTKTNTHKQSSAQSYQIKSKAVGETAYGGSTQQQACTTTASVNSEKQANTTSLINAQADLMEKIIYLNSEIQPTENEKFTKIDNQRKNYRNTNRKDSLSQELKTTQNEQKNTTEEFTEVRRRKKHGKIGSNNTEDENVGFTGNHN